MARHRRLPTLQGQLRHALSRTLTLSLVGSVLAVGIGAAYVAERNGDVSPVTDAVGVPTNAPERRLMKRFDCSAEGYADSATPLSAIVREPSGALRVVTFDKGWRLHTEGGPTRLVAVCLEPAR